ncbi:TetR/AcrR family transcriptional regulator [Dyella humicola]|uniref:TetR/AcrR family transcriptional regulator n=1 Tax=Dyella humicola TaxID=2992126 RepID=UPI002256A358|nr:TetR/AcrR family transcriptional regulator [Dyella humicola]
MVTAKKNSGTPRKPRADAERNRDRLMAVAKTAFAERGGDVTLEEIARCAGVGIGTLYRHFPTRDAMLQAVYRHEVEQLAEAATRLLASMKPLEALRAWLRLFVEYIGTKKLIVPALNAATSDSAALFEYSSAQIIDSANQLVAHAIESGDIHGDVVALDLLYAVFGFSKTNDQSEWVARAYRLIDILIAGLASGAAP